MHRYENVLEFFLMKTAFFAMSNKLIKEYWQKGNKFNLNRTASFKQKEANDDWFLCQIGSFCVDRFVARLRGHIVELCRRVLYHWWTCGLSHPARTRWDTRGILVQRIIKSYLTIASQFLLKRSPIPHLRQNPFAKRAHGGLLPRAGASGLSRAGSRTWKAAVGHFESSSCLTPGTLRGRQVIAKNQRGWG